MMFSMWSFITFLHPDNFKSADITHIYTEKDPTLVKSFGRTTLLFLQSNWHFLIIKNKLHLEPNIVIKTQILLGKTTKTAKNVPENI